jgi:hypothetical protein
MIVGARELADNSVLVLTSEDLRFVFLKTHDSEFITPLWHGDTMVVFPEGRDAYHAR